MDLFEFARFNGSDYNPARDDNRLRKQIGRVYQVMLDDRWFSLQELQACILDRFEVKDPESSISAQLRHLRKPRFGGHRVSRRLRVGTEGTWEYYLDGNA
jgi:hypothetical protein